jgi:lipase
VSLHVYEWGDPAGPPLVCVHGVAGHGARFRKLAEERLGRFRVVAPDLRGHGRSEWAPPWRLEQHLEDLLDTAAALGIDRATWLGHSFGGRLALELAARSPERVEAIVLFDPAIWVPPPFALQHAEEARAEQSFASPDEAVAWRVASGTVVHAPRELLEEEAEAHLERSGDGRLRFRYSRAAVVAAYGELSVPPPPFEAIRAHALLVRGAASDVCPDVLVDLLREPLGSRLTVVDVPGGHTVFWDAFTETADAVVAFLDLQDRRS